MGAMKNILATVGALSLASITIAALGGDKIIDFLDRKSKELENKRNLKDGDVEVEVYQCDGNCKTCPNTDACRVWDMKKVRTAMDDIYSKPAEKTDQSQRSDEKNSPKGTSAVPHNATENVKITQHEEDAHHADMT